MKLSKHVVGFHAVIRYIAPILDADQSASLHDLIQSHYGTISGYRSILDNLLPCPECRRLFIRTRAKRVYCSRRCAGQRNARLVVEEPEKKNDSII